MFQVQSKSGSYFGTFAERAEAENAAAAACVSKKHGHEDWAVGEKAVRKSAEPALSAADLGGQLELVRTIQESLLKRQLMAGPGHKILETLAADVDAAAAKLSKLYLEATTPAE